MQLVELRLVRTPGIRQPFTLTPAAGVNLVTGPNGVGKSSICRAVLALLWPGLNQEQPFEAAATFTNGDHTLTVTRQDRNSPLWSGPKPDLGPDHLAVRYRLGAIDLLAPDRGRDPGADDPLAKELRTHMTGGFDLDQVRRDLFGTRTGLAESRALKGAAGTAARLQAQQRALAAEQERLTELERTRQAAGKARDRLAVLDMLRHLGRQRQARDEAADRLAHLPPGAARVRPDDPRKLAALRLREDELVRQIEERTASLKTIARELAGLAGNRQGAADLPLDLLKRKRDTLTQLSQDVRQAERDVHDAHRSAILEEVPRPRRVLPFLAAVCGGAALLAMGFLLFGPGDGLRQLFLAGGAALTSVGLWGWFTGGASPARTEPSPDRKLEMARKKDFLEACSRQRDEALAAFNAALAEAGIQPRRPVTDPAEADQVLEEYGQRQARGRELGQARDRDSGFLDLHQADLVRVRTEIGELCERLDLDPAAATDADVSRLLERNPSFVQAEQDRDNAARDIARLTQGVAAGAALLREGETDATGADILDRLMEQERNLADGLESLQQDIARIRAGIDQAYRGHDVQVALAAVAAARTSLAEVRQSNREAALGNLLLERVALQHEMESRPRVLEKAATYFRLFTGNAYELKMAGHDGGPERFLAQAEDALRPLELDELSDGTRAQLLLAVKLAFICAGEEGARPPIFLDDSLTSADPDRFAAAAVSLGRLAAQEGRQIFYLTPDPADAAAFQRALAGAGLPAAGHIDLARLRGCAGAAEAALLEAANLPPLAMAPDPAGATPPEYAQALRVPRPDPWAPPGAIHVFFLLEDELDLVRRLVDGKAATLGRAEKGMPALVAARQITPDQAALVSARGAVWSAWLDGWRIGRAQPVSREFLAASSAVTAAYLDRVTEVLPEVGGDGALLLAALDEGRVKGFRNASKDQLRQDMEQAGHLDPRAPLSDDDLVAHTLARVAPQMAARVLDMQKVRTLALTFAQLVDVPEKPVSPRSS